MTEILERPHRIDNYNHAVDMITERGVRSQVPVRTNEAADKGGDDKAQPKFGLT